MKILISFLTVLAFASVAFAESPQLTVKDSVYDFGSVDQGEVVKHQFQIKNTGPGDLEIKEVTASCGCTVASLEKNLLKPDEETNVAVEFDTTGFWGEKLKSVYVYSNDPSQSVKALTLQGIVRRDVEISPSRLFFGNIPKNKKRSKSFKIILDKSSGIELKKVKSRSKYISVSKTKQEEEGEDIYDIEVTLTANRPVGVFRNRVIVYTTSKKNPVITIPVFARIRGDFSFDPPDLSFGVIEGPLKEDKKRTVRLISHTGEQVNIKSVKTSSSDISVSYSELDDSKLYKFEILLNEGFLGSLDAEIEVTTDHPDSEQKVIKLPVYGIVVKKEG